MSQYKNHCLHFIKTTLILCNSTHILSYILPFFVGAYIFALPGFQKDCMSSMFLHNLLQLNVQTVPWVPLPGLDMIWLHFTAAITHRSFTYKKALRSEKAALTCWMCVNSSTNVCLSFLFVFRILFLQTCLTNMTATKRKWLILES